jgi:AraC-like DNA-binding protein
MRPQLIPIDNEKDQSVTIRYYKEPRFQNAWHYHKELELVYVIKGEGTRFVGDNIEDFRSDDLVLLGTNLPHRWKNQITFDAHGHTRNAEAIVIHFNAHFLGKDFLEIPEMWPIKALFSRARQGIKLSKKLKYTIAKSMKNMLELSNYDRLLALLHILKLIAEDHNVVPLSGYAFMDNIHQPQNRKLDGIFEFVMNNFSNRITLEQAAQVANMNRTAFCKYFKDRTSKTFFQFLHEVRIGYACRLLMEQNLNISEICFECGFNNLSNFNRQFRKYTHLSPGEYQKSHRPMA